MEIYEYSTLYFAQNILPFFIIGALDSKRVLRYSKYVIRGMVDVATFVGQPVK